MSDPDAAIWLSWASEKTPESSVFSSLANVRVSRMAVKLIKRLQCLQYRPCFRHFMRAEQIGFTECCQHGKKGFGATDFVAKKFKRMRKRVANWPAERPQTKRVQEHAHL